MTSKFSIAALLLGSSLSLFSVQSFAAQADHITIKDPYAREVPPGAPASASFMKLSNASNTDIQIIKANSEVAKVVELHTHTNDNGVMRMRKIPNINIPAMGQTELKPGGLHIMLIGPHQPLKMGQTVNVTLTFKDGSTKAVSMPVKSLKGMPMMKHKMQHGHEHGHMHH